jgi:hypothetical protein
VADAIVDFVPIPNDASFYTVVITRRHLWLLRLFGEDDDILIIVSGAILGETVFGGLHCPAWKF